MASQSNQDFEKMVFGDYQVSKSLPFRIAQAPFRKFSKYQRDGHWNEKERLKYTVFLGYFQALLEDPELKKNARIYEMMSDMIITRNPSQCRSHHQKMEKYRSTIKDIISSVTDKYEPSIYEEIKDKYTVFIKTLLENSDKYIRLPTSTQKRKEKTKKNHLPKPNLKISIKNTRGDVISQAQLKEEEPKQKKKELKKTNGQYSDEQVQEEEKPQNDLANQSYAMKNQKIQLEQINDIYQESYPSRQEFGYFQAEKREMNQIPLGHQFSLGGAKLQLYNHDPRVKKERKDSLVFNLEDLAQGLKPIEKGLKKTQDKYSDESNGLERQEEGSPITPCVNRPANLHSSLMFMPMGENLQGGAGVIPLYMPFQTPSLLNIQKQISDLQEEKGQVEREMNDLLMAYNSRWHKSQELAARISYLQSYYGQHP